MQQVPYTPEYSLDEFICSEPGNKETDAKDHEAEKEIEGLLVAHR